MSGLDRLFAPHDQADGSALLKSSPRVRVTRVAFDEGGDAVCKEDRRRSVRVRLGNAVFGTRAERSLRAAQALREAGFHVPEPLGLANSEGRTLYVARHVAGPTLAQALDRSDSGQAFALALEAVALCARLHVAGFAFRDLKPPNLIVTPRGLVPVDLDDVSRPRRLPRRIAWRNLAALDAYAQVGARPLSARARHAALEAYAQQRGLAVRDVLTPVLTLSRAKRRRWAEQ